MRTIVPLLFGSTLKSFWVRKKVIARLLEKQQLLRFTGNVSNKAVINSRRFNVKALQIV